MRLIFGAEAAFISLYIMGHKNFSVGVLDGGRAKNS